MITASKFERQLEAKHRRRIRREDAYVAREEKREAMAERHIGTLIREGRTVYYVWPPGGLYKEGGFFDLVKHLVRIGIVN
jgi:hypothetical protein